MPWPRLKHGGQRISQCKCNMRDTALHYPKIPHGGSKLVGGSSLSTTFLFAVSFDYPRDLLQHGANCFCSVILPSLRLPLL